MAGFSKHIFSKRSKDWFSLVNIYFYRDMTNIPSDLKPTVKALRSQGITSLVYQQLKTFSEKGSMYKLVYFLFRILCPNGSGT